MSEIKESDKKNCMIKDPVYQTNHKAGEHNVEIMGMDLHNPVFFFSASLIVFFVILTLVFPDLAKQSFDASKSWSINHFDWLFIVSGNIFVLFCLALVVSPLGKIRLGGTEAKA